MRRFPVMLPLLLLALIPDAAAWAAGPAVPLVFTRGDTVYRLEPGAGRPRRIGTGRQPALSPDGRRAVWVEAGGDPARSRLVLRDLDGGAASVLASPGGFLGSPGFSPDGRSVAFTRAGEDGRRELWTVRPGGRAVRLARVGDDCFEPAWSAAEGAVACHDMKRLFLIAPDGRVLRETPLAAFAGGRDDMFSSADRFAVHPFAARIVFSMGVPGTPLFRKKVPDISSALFLFDPATGKTSRLTPENLTAFAPAWTPDGEAVVFTGYTDARAGAADPFEIWMLRPGGVPERIGPGEDAKPPAAAGRAGP